MASNPHDKLVKKTFSIMENAEGELRAMLPEGVAKRIDWATLRLEPGSFVDADAQEWHTDLLFSVELGDRPLMLYLLLEHQSSVDRWMPLRMLTYIVRIWNTLRDDGAERLPLVLPLVLHHSQSGWTAARHMRELFDADDELLSLLSRYVPSFEILIDDLGLLEETELLLRPMTSMARVTLWVLRAQRSGYDPAQIAAWVEQLERAQSNAQDDASREAFEVFFVYLSEVEGGSELLDAILGSVDENVREVVMGLRKQWEDEAEARGEARGRADGEARGRSEALLKLLRLRFTVVPDHAIARIRAASVEDLDRWIERVLSSKRLEDLWG